MAAHTGRLGAVYSSSNKVAEVRDWSIEETSEVVAKTVMGDEWVGNLSTLKSWTASFNAYWDDDATSNQDEFSVGSTVTLNLYPEGQSSGKTYWSGSAIVTSVSKSASFDGLIEASFSVTGDGQLSESTYSV